MNNSGKGSVCFTGHRKIIHLRLKERVTEIITILAEEGYRNFITGGALGFDMLAARCVVDLKDKYDGITLTIAIPCREQSSRWSRREKQAYENMLDAADDIVVLSEEYFSGCMHNRNRYMVDNSEVCVCYMYKRNGGTSYTVDYAEKKGKTIVMVI